MYTFSLSEFHRDPSFPFFIQYGCHDNDLFMHTHEDFSELVIVLSGSATHVVNEAEYLVGQGDVFVITDHAAHGYIHTNRFRVCNIMFHNSLLPYHDEDIIKSLGFHALFICAPYYLKTNQFKAQFHLKDTQFQTIKTLSETMRKEYEKKEVGWQTALTSSFTYLITLLSRYYQLAETTSPVPASLTALAEVASYINSHYTETLSIKELATMSHYSERHFSRRFTEIYKVSPLDYILSLRLARARRMLLQDQSPISEIALVCGFSNLNYFCRVFKKYVGLTPSQYRLTHLVT